MHKKISFLIGFISTLILCSVVFTLPNNANVAAEGIGDAGHDGGWSGAGTGSSNCGTQAVGNCKGGGWTYHTTDSDYVVVPDHRPFVGGVITNCAAVGGYYKSSWFRYGDINSQVALAPNNYWKGVGGWHEYNSQAVPLDHVFQQFQIAVQRGVVEPGTTWNNVSWFCSDDKDVPITPPTPGGGDTPPTTASTEFRTRSKIKVNDDDIKGGAEFLSEEEDSVEAFFSTDKESVTVVFSHEIYYYHGGFTMGSRDTVTGDTVSAKWDVKDKENSSYSTSGKVGAWKPDQDHSQKPLGEHNVTITFGRDEYGEKKACSEINHDKGVLLQSKYICDSRDQNGNCTSGHYEWSSSITSQGKSYACVTVYRPQPPSGKITANGVGGGEDGGTTNQVMFAGETTELQWADMKAKDIYTRRLAAYMPIVFEVNENPGYDASKLAKTKDFNIDPCGLYGTQRFGSSTVGCKQYDSSDVPGKQYLENGKLYVFPTKNDVYKEAEDKGTFSKSDTFKVPDFVGHKYCNSFGYKFEYWYGEKKGGGSITWKKDDKDYWYNFNASCRTVAKKPSTAVWNGSILSTGSLVSSLAKRHNDVRFGELADNSKKLYGSWSEYLAIAKTWPNNGKTMASGSTLSTGSSQLSICDSKPWESNSPLSISNFSTNTDACDLRASNITANSTFLTRLNAYFNNEKNTANIHNVTNVNELYGNLSGNQLLRVSGSDLTIEQDIKVDGNYNLHDLPQAVIIVDGGNVNIASNVKRVDAWLIVTSSGGRGGTINTCHYEGHDFQPGRDTGVQSDTDSKLVNPCTEQLAFNGPVIANRVNLQRSYGANNHTRHRTNAYGNSNGIGNKETPAEIFNLRADAYIWGYAQASRYNSSYSEAYSRELAPRY